MADIKDKIIEGATQCFIRYGYSKTTLDDIGKSVGLKKNSLYHYFKNKEEIFFAVLNNELARNASERKQLVEQETGIKNQILAYMNVRLQSCNQSTILHSILTEIWNAQHPLFDRVFELLREKETRFLESLFITAYHKHEIIQYDYTTLAESLLLVCNAVKQQELSHSSFDDGSHTGMKQDQQILFIVETLLKGIEIR